MVTSYVTYTCMQDCQCSIAGATPHFFAGAHFFYGFILEILQYRAPVPYPPSGLRLGTSRGATRGAVICTVFLLDLRSIWFRLWNSNRQLTLGSLTRV